MIKCEVNDNRPVYNGERPHIVFYKGYRGSSYVIAKPIIIGESVTDPDEVMQILTRGFSIDSVFAIEDGDIDELRRMYDKSSNNA